MGYLHIENLYKAQDILLFKEAYAMEKIHGSSAHVSYKDEKLNFFSGGEKHETFLKIFDLPKLEENFKTLGHGSTSITVYGEVYGGKCQGMKATYGDTLKFIVFDVDIADHWLDVPNAHDVTNKLGLEFVHYVKIPTDITAIDAQRDAPSVQAVRNGITEPKMREGVVLRPLIEVQKNNGSRIISKHKRPEFSERKTIPEVDPAKREILEKAESIALEWVTEMRLSHVLDKLGSPTDMRASPEVIKAMIEDVTREASGEIIDSKEARKAIGSRAVKLFKEKLTASLHQPLA